MQLTKYERLFLIYYQQKHNAKWMKVYYNKHFILETKVDLYNIYKRKLRSQPKIGQLTYTGMFKQLNEGEWYYIPTLLKNK